MKFSNTRNLSFDEILHYADLGLIEGFDQELPSDFISSIRTQLDVEFDEGCNRAKEDIQDQIAEAYDEGYEDGKTEWGS